MYNITIGKKINSKIGAGFPGEDPADIEEVIIKQQQKRRNQMLLLLGLGALLFMAVKK